MTRDAIITALKADDAKLGEFQSFVAFKDGSSQAWYQHGSRQFANDAELAAWCQAVTAPTQTANAA